MTIINLFTLRTLIDTKDWDGTLAQLDKLLATLPKTHHEQVLRQTLKLINDDSLLINAHCYERLLPLVTPKIQRNIYTRLDTLYHKHALYEQAGQAAKQALLLRDKESCDGRFGRRIVAFSLYGSDPAYCETLILNAKAMPNIYPNWIMRVYHDDSVPPPLIGRLKALGVECVHAKDVDGMGFPGTFWRFLAAEDECDAVIFRDADSIIGERERRLVDEWLTSNKPFHVMRDYYGQTHLILAGMWGVRHGLLSGIRRDMQVYVNSATLHPKYADQDFLDRCVWPKIKHYCLHHSSVIKDVLGSTWPDDLPELNVIDPQTQALCQIGSWQLSTHTPDIDKAYMMFLYDENDQEVCQYAFEAGQSFDLPKHYRTLIKQGLWKLEFRERLQTTVTLPGGGTSTATIVIKRKKQPTPPKA